MNKPLQERFAAALRLRGECLIKQTFKYQVWSRAKGGHYYLGRAGALRFGPTATKSIPCGETFRTKLLDMVR